MSRNIVAFDVETTGLDTNKDYVIQLSAVKFDSDFNIIGEMNEYVIPPHSDWEIAEGAFEKHGLTKEFIKENGRYIYDVGVEFLNFTDDCDMLSYNGNKFDVKILSKDLRLVDLQLDLNRTFFDALALEAKLQPRTLDVIYKKYTGKVLENAHNALYDVKATIEIFRHQVENFHEQGISIDEIMGFDESKVFCVDGMIKKDGDKIVFAKGKHRGVDFMDVCANDKGYIKWFMDNPDFDRHTKQILRDYYAQSRVSGK